MRAEEQTPEAGSASRELPLWAEVLVLAAILGAALAARWPFRHVVLIRDEGEYAYLGQQILRGVIPYQDAYNQKTPFVFYLMAAIQAAAGPGLPALRLATVGYGWITTVFLYLLTRRLLGPGAAFGAALAFNVMTFNQCGLVHTASTEFYMLLWIVLGVDLWYRGRASGRAALLVLAGAAAGLAYQTKQTGMAVLAFFLVERSVALWWSLKTGVDSSEAKGQGGAWRGTVRDLVLAGLGFAGVLAAVVVYFAAHGALGAYVECTWTNNWQYVGQRFEDPFGVLLLGGDVITTVARWDVGLWLWGSVGLAGLARTRPAAQGGSLWMLLLLLAAAGLGTGKPYAHYYEPLIVPLAIGSGAALAWLGGQLLRPGQRLWLRGVLAVLLVVPFVWPALRWGTLLHMSDAEFQQINQALSPSGIAVQAADYVAERTTPDECILVIGSEPEIYYYADRTACTRLVFTFPLAGPYTYAPGLQQEFRRDFQAHQPRYVVLANSLSERPFQPDGFLSSLLQVLDAHYVLETEFRDRAGGELKVFRRQASW
jgi:hypothetical protein